MRYTATNKETDRRNARNHAHDLCRVLCEPTLNGQRAKIMGWSQDFATVGQLNGPLTAEYSWQTVCRVLTTKHGKFEA